MRHLILILCCLSLGAAAPAVPITREPTRLSILARQTLGKDFRITWHVEKNADICGGQGDAWVGQAEMNKPQRAIGRDGQVTLKDHWVKVDKQYAIFVSDLSQSNPQLFDGDSCLE